MIDTKKLEEGLSKLTGFDYTKTELKVRRSGDMTPDMTFSKGFQIELAALALKENVQILKALNAREFNYICTVVSNFLLSGLAEEAVQDNTTDELQDSSVTAEL